MSPFACDRTDPRVVLPTSLKGEIIEVVRAWFFLTNGTVICQHFSNAVQWSCNFHSQPFVMDKDTTFCIFSLALVKIIPSHRFCSTCALNDFDIIDSFYKLEYLLWQLLLNRGGIKQRLDYQPLFWQRPCTPLEKESRLHSREELKSSLNWTYRDHTNNDCVIWLLHHCYLLLECRDGGFLSGVPLLFDWSFFLTWLK